MDTELYVLVYVNRDGKQEMETHKTVESLLDNIGKFHRYTSATFQRVFSVSSSGQVSHYNVVFEGKLKLTRIVKAKESKL